MLFVKGRQRTVVIDVGYFVDRGGAVIEFNAAWGAGLNGCDPEKSLASCYHGIWYA